MPLTLHHLGGRERRDSDARGDRHAEGAERGGPKGVARAASEAGNGAIG